MCYLHTNNLHFKNEVFKYILEWQWQKLGFCFNQLTIFWSDFFSVTDKNEICGKCSNFFYFIVKAHYWVTVLQLSLMTALALNMARYFYVIHKPILLWSLDRKLCSDFYIGSLYKVRYYRNKDFYTDCFDYLAMIWNNACAPWY